MSSDGSSDRKDPPQAAAAEAGNDQEINDAIIPEVLAHQQEQEQQREQQQQEGEYPRGEQEQMELEDMTQLQILVELGEWDQVEKRLKTHPQEILPGRMTALHLALEGGDCPFHILREMLELEPMLPSLVDKTGGNTPLHMACAGEFAYDPFVIAMLLAAYPQATLQQDFVEKTTPLHMLLQMGGNVNLTCLKLILDVGYSVLAGLSPSFVLGLEFLTGDLGTCLMIGKHYPPLMVQVIREMALCDPMSFPAFLRPFLHLSVTPDIIPAQLKSDGESDDDEDSGNKIPLLIQDQTKQVPLHIACRRGVGAEATELVLRYPGARRAAATKEHKDRYPLHYAAIYAMPVESAKAVYNCSPPHVTKHYERYGMTPYQLAQNGPTFLPSDRAFELKHDLVQQRSNEQEEVTEELFVSQKAHQLYRLVCFFLSITIRNLTDDASLLTIENDRMQEEDSTWRVLDDACKVPSPPSFLRCLCTLFPSQLSNLDSSGYLPLHYACAVLRPEGMNDRFPWMQAHFPYADQVFFRLLPENRIRDSSIAVICKACPTAARTLTPDSDLPLHLAILSNKGMEDGISVLLEAAPMALATRNMKHRLYPFQLAAIEETNSLDVTYELLLANPMMVQSGIR